MPRFTAARRCFLLLAFSWIAAPLVAADLGQMVSGEPPGVHQTEKLAKKAEAMIEEVEKAQQQVRQTLTSYDALLFGNATDLRKPYRALDSEIERCDKRREAVRRRADAARAESTDYFRAWAGSLPLIESADLRARSEVRLRDSKARFDGIIAAGTNAAAAYQPFIGRLRDQWNYLGHDLNPSGLESLRPDARKLADEGQTLLAQIDESLRQAREYVASIRSRQPPPPPPPPAPPATPGS